MPTASSDKEVVSTISSETNVTIAQHQSAEEHNTHSGLIRDAIIGFADGLTVPFALTAGLSSLGNNHLVILAGLAELFSGAISMGLGAYLAAVTDRKHYFVEEQREWREVKTCPGKEEEEVYEIFEKYGVARSESKGVVDGLKANEEMWVKFMMDFELKLEKPQVRMAWIEGLVMGVSYFVGGLLPMIPYFAFTNTHHALFTSIGISAVILVAFGYVKAQVIGCTVKDRMVSAVQTLFVGAVAAAVSYGIVYGVNSANPTKLGGGA